MLTEKGLGSGADAKSLLELFAAAVGDPCDFGSKTFDMVFFSLQKAFGNEYGHGHIFVAALFDHTVEYLLYIFPYGLGVGAEDYAALHGRVVAKLGLFNDVGVPLGKVLVSRGDRRD